MVYVCQFKNEESIPIEIIAQFVFYERTGELIYNFIKTNYNNCKIINHFNSFFKFGVHYHASPGLIMGQLELNVHNPLKFFLFNVYQKKNLNINQYGIFKTALERVLYYINRGQYKKVKKEMQETQKSKNLHRLRKRFRRVGSNISSNYSESQDGGSSMDYSFLSSMKDSSYSSFKSIQPVVHESPFFSSKTPIIPKVAFFHDQPKSIELPKMPSRIDTENDVVANEIADNEGVLEAELEKAEN